GRLGARPEIRGEARQTPVLSSDEARKLLDSIESDTLIGLRDRALIGTMVYSFALVGGRADSEPSTIEHVAEDPGITGAVAFLVNVVLDRRATEHHRERKVAEG